MTFRTHLLLALFLIAGLALQAQVTVDNTLTAQELVEDYLIGEGIEVENITINGQPGSTVNNQAGLYAGSSDVVDFDEGIVMATGNATTVVTGGFGDPPTNPLQNDPDLMVLSGQDMNDVIIIEFDFLSTSDSIKFNYVFASNEYPGYTCSNFNDVFGFFLSGGAINGPFTNNAINIALIPGSNTPVGINTVNSGVSTGGADSTCAEANPNWIEDSQYFVDNTGEPADDVQFPGMTQTFTALADVDCGEWYHIKLAIGDASDGALDSGVFLEAGSFSAVGSVFLQFNPTIDGAAVINPEYDSVLVAGCSELELQLIRPEGLYVDSIFVDFSGSAELDEDYELGENDTLFFFADGIDTLEFSIITLWDGVYGENEELIVTLFYQNGCGDLDSVSDTIPIVDPYALESYTQDVIITCPAEGVEVTAQGLEGIDPYLYDWGNYGFGQEVTVDVPPDSAYYYVNISDACAFEIITDSVLVVNKIPPPLEASIAPFEQPECTNQPMYFEALSQGGNGAHTYSWIDGRNEGHGHDTLIIVANINQTIFFNPEPTNYTAMLPLILTVTDTCGTTVKDTVVINYPYFDPVTVNYSPLTDNCPEDPVELSAVTSGGAGNTDFTWAITAEAGDATFADGHGAQAQTTYIIPAPGMNEITVIARDKCNRAGYDYQITDPNNPAGLRFGGMAMHTDSVRIIKLDKVMNVITPNQDNMNDYFVVEGIDYFDESLFQVHDRWGTVVFESDNYNSGSSLIRSADAFDGQDLDTGTYFYVINVDHGECVTSGTLEILRKNN